MAALRSPLARSWPVTTRFGDPNAVTRAPHTGVDFGAPFGTPVLAAAAGVARRWWNAGGGNMVGIIHDDGTETRYAHLALALVGGVRVAAGQQIGTVGSTGLLVTGAHLHFEYLVDGRFVDPLPALAGAGPGSSIGAPLPKPVVDYGDMFPVPKERIAEGCPPGYQLAGVDPRVHILNPLGVGPYNTSWAGAEMARNVPQLLKQGVDVDPATSGWRVACVRTGVQEGEYELNKLREQLAGAVVPMLFNVAVIGGAVLLIYRGVVTILKP